MKKEFTIGGVPALREAITKHTGVPLFSGRTLAHNFLSTSSLFGEYLCGTNEEEKTHYHLPEDWKKAVRAIKEYYTEENRWEKGKWYYGVGIYTFLGKYSHAIQGGDLVFSESFLDDTYCDAGDVVYKGKDIYNSLVPATKEQLLEAFTKEAERRAYHKAKRINCLKYGEMSDFTFEKFDLFNDKLWMDVEGNDTIIIYKKGKWAEILEEPKPEGMVLKGVKVGDAIWSDITLTPEHLQQLEAYFTKK